MKYCYDCGKQVNADDMFCSSCGIKQDEDLVISSQEKTKEQQDNIVRGIIFTNTKVLSKKFNVSTESISDLLNTYVETLLNIGLEYKIIDCSKYRCLNPEATILNRNISLNPEKDSWTEYSKILTDDYCFAYEEDKPIFLFIIGGDDIIPMPCIHNKSSCKDKDVDTDMLYSYLLDEKTFSHVKSGSIFYYTPYFHIGRLPMGKDTTFDYLSRYFERSIKIYDSNGLFIQSAYGQTNASWTSASGIVSESIRNLDLFPHYDEILPEGCSYMGLVRSPHILDADVGKVLNTDANLLYFNLHGMDVPNESGSHYFADEGSAISPTHIQKVDVPNIFIVEACYGTRFIDLKTNESMMLSAMDNTTIAFLGSSRIAWGLTNKDLNQIHYADIICRIFIDAILSGVCFGAALQYAKSEFAKNCSDFCTICETTLTEFNLFGDPALRAQPYNDGTKSARSLKSSAKSTYLTPLIDENTNTVKESKEVYRSGTSLSVLEMVRNKVDAAFTEIKAKVDKNLYEVHNINPRELSFVNKLTFKNSKVEYHFSYKNSKDYMTIAIIDKDGEIKNIIMSK